MTNARIIGAEAIGTGIVVLGGVGTAVLAAGTGGLGESASLAVALAFGVALFVATFAVAPVTGAHLNPAVTVAMVVMRRIEAAVAPVYIAGQVLGAIGAAFTVWVIRRGRFDGFDATTANFHTNVWGAEHAKYDLAAVAFTEVVLTALVVFVYLAARKRGLSPAGGGIAIGLTLTLAHLVSLPIDNTGVNPARSLATALFAGGDALAQVWAFIVFPILGGLLGVLAWIAVDEVMLEDTMLADTPLDEVRDAIEQVTN